MTAADARSRARHHGGDLVGRHIELLGVRMELDRPRAHLDDVVELEQRFRSRPRMYRADREELAAPFLPQRQDLVVQRSGPRKIPRGAMTKAATNGYRDPCRVRR